GRDAKENRNALRGSHSGFHGGFAEAAVRGGSPCASLHCSPATAVPQGCVSVSALDNWRALRKMLLRLSLNSVLRRTANRWVSPHPNYLPPEGWMPRWSPSPYLIPARIAPPPLRLHKPVHNARSASSVAVCRSPNVCSLRRSPPAA